jgi:hypothetical protein
MATAYSPEFLRPDPCTPVPGLPRLVDADLVRVEVVVAAP